MDECTEEAFGAKLPTSELFSAYEGWCDANGERPLPQRGLTNKLDELDYNLVPDRSNKKAWRDLKLSQEGLAYASKEYLHRIPGGDLTASFMQQDQRVG